MTGADDGADGQAADGRRVEVAATVPLPAERAWAAVATGPGLSSWFVPTVVDGGVGGRMVMSFGDYGDEEAEIEVWEPPHRLVYRSLGDRPLLSAWHLGPDGDTAGTTIALTQSGFEPGRAGDAEVDALDDGWRIFLRHLTLRATRFPDLTAAPALATLVLPGSQADVWASLCEAMELPPEAEAGEVIDSGGSAPPLVATVDSAWWTRGARAYLLVVQEPDSGTGFVAVEGDGDQAAASVYLYLNDGDPAEAGRLARRWTDWMSERFLPLEDRLG